MKLFPPFIQGLLLAGAVLWARLTTAAEHHVVFIIAEAQYRAAESLPEFAKDFLSPRPEYRITFLNQSTEDKYHLAGLVALKQADLVVLYVRRRSLLPEDMAFFKDYLSAGNPLLALRTSSHAWDTRNRGPRDQVEWKTFDPEVLGGNYQGHHADGIETTIAVVPGMEAHPILMGVDLSRLIGKGSLYKASPLSPRAQVILVGSIPGASTEPVLWQHPYGRGRVVYTSLGHPGDFAQPNFNRLLLNAIRHLLNSSPLPDSRTRRRPLSPPTKLP